MKKVLVTGATGFIGGHVMEELLKQPVSVVASSADASKISAKKWFSKVEYVPFDMSSVDDSTDYYAYFGKPDILIHLAWEGLPNYRSAFHTEINLPRHIHFLHSMIRGGLKDMTVTGTCFEYGMREGLLQEDMDTFPDNFYAKAKDALRKQLEEFQLTYHFSLKWLRLFYMYGKGQNPNSLLSQLDKALAAGEESFNMSGGEQVRDFMPVENVAAAIVKTALQNRVTGIINCCSGRPVTVKEFVAAYLAGKNKEIKLNLGYYPYPDYEPMRFWGDNSKLKKIINNE